MSCTRREWVELKKKEREGMVKCKYCTKIYDSDFRFVNGKWLCKGCLFRTY